MAEGDINIYFRLRKRSQKRLLFRTFALLKEKKSHLHEQLSADIETDCRALQSELLAELCDTIFDLCNEEVLSHFDWPSLAEKQARYEAWQKLSLDERWQKLRMEKGAWDFESLIEALLNGEYELLVCHVGFWGKGYLRFNTWSYPFGGITPLKAFLEAFGCELLSDDLFGDR